MANLKTIQFLRNASLYASLEAAKSALTTKAAELLDGSPVAGRYKVQTGTTEAEFEVRSILGIVYNGTLSFLLNEKEIASALDGLDYSGITTSSAAVVTNVTEADGKISATSENVGNLVLTDYAKGSESGAVASTDSINAAFSKLEKQIDAANDVINYLDASSVSGESKVVIDVTQDGGQITASAANLTGVKLGGLGTGSDAKIAATDTLGEALANIQAQIDAMDKSASAEDGKVVTTVSEIDGKVSETKANVKDLQLGGYAKSNSTGDIASGDTINEALSKLENKAAAITIGNEDGSVNVTPATSGTDINVNIKTGEHVLAKDGSAGLYTNIALSSITPSSTTVKEEYQLTATDGTKLGTTIKIYKDSSVVSIDYQDNPSEEHYQNLIYTYVDVSGNTQTAYVDMSKLILEAEFGSGITVNAAGVAHGVVDPSSESFFTVGADGFKVAGISGFVQTEIEKLDATVGSQTIATGKHVAVEVVEADGKLSALTVVENDIASAQGLADEIDARTSGDTELSNRLGTGVTTANTATAQLIALSGNSSTDTSATTSVEGAKRYADAILANSVAGLDADESGSTAHITVNVVEEDGVITEVNVEEDDIANASDLEELSGKTFTVIGSSNNSISSVTSSTADGTVGIDIVTDGGKIKATGFNAAATSGTPAATDSVSDVLSKLYGNAKMNAVKAGSATTVVAAADGTTVDVKLDESSALSVNNNDGNGNNALMITNDGLFLSKDWDCGTF